MHVPIGSSHDQEDMTDLIFWLVIGGFIAITLIYFVVISRHSGSAQWALVLILITISVLVAMIFVKRQLKKPHSLHDVQPGESDAEGELSELRKALERADSGLTYSQLVVKDRITRILLDRIRIENDLTLEEMRSLRRDGDSLKSLIDDKFLLDSINSFLNDINNWSETIKGKGDPEFLRKVNEILERMEA